MDSREQEEKLALCGSGSISGIYKPREADRLERIERYIHLLCMANEAGHAVNHELREALEQYKKEAGI